MPKKAATSDAAPAAAAVSGMKVQELRNSLSALGADTSGTKAVLAARLTDLRKRAAAPEDEPPAKVAKPAPPAAAAAPSKSIRTAIVKGRAAVDSYCDVAATTHVYEGSGGEVFDALLNQTDIVKNANKFYVIQLLETDASPPKYYTWTRWGRVGEKGQSALLPPSGASLDACLDSFHKKFHDKTKNSWAQRDAFRAVPGKYTLLAVDYGADEPDPAPSARGGGGGGTSSGGEPLRSGLDERVGSLVSLLCDVKMMEAQMREIGFDADKMPLGKLQRRTILQGYEVLQHLAEVIGGPAASSGSASSSASACSASGGTARSGGDGGAAGGARVVELSNQFYSLIPHVSVSEKSGAANRLQRLPLIDTPSRLKAKIEMVEALGEIELASRVIGTKAPAFDKHPLDLKYDQIGAKLTPIDKGSATHQLLQQYMANTHAATHGQYSLELEQAFEVERPGEAERFVDKGNRQLLWHGSRLTNWAGILSQGLRIAPPEAPVTGYMFDKGVYFADMVSKSANYCFASRQAPTGVLLLCDVSLGDQYERLQAEYRAGASAKKARKDSTFGKGATGPDPAGTVPLPSDPAVLVPKGKAKKTAVANSSLLYNEFIVYDVAQVRQKYLLRVKFHMQ